MFFVDLGAWFFAPEASAIKSITVFVVIAHIETVSVIYIVFAWRGVDASFERFGALCRTGISAEVLQMQIPASFGAPETSVVFFVIFVVIAYI